MALKSEPKPFENRQSVAATTLTSTTLASPRKKTLTSLYCVLAPDLAATTAVAFKNEHHILGNDKATVITQIAFI